MRRRPLIAAGIVIAAALPPLAALWGSRSAVPAATAPTRRVSRAVAPLAPESVAAAARAAGLLVERVAGGPDGGVDLVVSGREAAVLRLVDRWAREGRRSILSRWSLDALGGDGVRLSGHIVPAAISAGTTPPAPLFRPLFGTASAPSIAPDAPALAGIVGRLPDDAVALVRGEDGGTTSVSPGGAAAGGWRLDALSADAAIFSRGGERVRVALPPAED